MASQKGRSRDTSKDMAVRGNQNNSVKKQRQERQRKEGRQLHGTPASNAAESSIRHTLPSGLQQSILDVFAQAFHGVAQSASYEEITQQVKGHLYNRDFLAAFSKQEYLDAYALRWSAARALAYADIFTHPDRLIWLHPAAETQALVNDPKLVSDQDNITKPLPGTTLAETDAKDIESSNAIVSSRLASVPHADPPQSDSTTRMNVPATSIASTPVKAVCIGGGAGAEIVALAAARHAIHSNYNNADANAGQSIATSSTTSNLEILAVDIANWSECVRKISSALTAPLPLPSYVSQAVHDARRPLCDPRSGQVIINFQQEDVLEMTQNSLDRTFHDVLLVTVMFTLNELFNSSLPKTTALLLNLTEVIKLGAHLIVVDSPGSYSEIQLGQSNQQRGNQSTKKYPMKWLLDHTLLEVAGKGTEARWAKIENKDSEWFRIDKKIGLRYGIELENCRFQIHGFRKLR